jgi:hypothetical protein
MGTGFPSQFQHQYYINDYSRPIGNGSGCLDDLDNNRFNNVNNCSFNDTSTNLPDSNINNVNNIFQVLQKKGLVISQLNSCSLTQNFDELRHILTNNHIDILGLTETFLCDDIGDNNVNVDNFFLYRNDRNNSSNEDVRRGGVALYVNQNCNHKIRKDLTSDMLEILSV